jgi:hypothetical protein
MIDEREVLSALIDRETVDPDTLARVLEDPAGRRALVDFVRLRVKTLADDSPLPVWQPTPHTFPGFWSQRAWARAAAILLLCVAAAGGGAWIQRYVSREGPPVPGRVVQFDPVPHQGPATVAATPAGN